MDFKLCFGVMMVLTVSSVLALVCTEPEQLKVTVKIPDPTAFDEIEQYFFQGTLAYAIRRCCNDSNCVSNCTGQNISPDTVNVHLTNKTKRFAMCVTVDNVSLSLMEDSIRYSRDRFNGALELNDDTLVISGVPPTLKAETVPDFPIWLIPFIVITCLVVLAAAAILGYTVYQTKKESSKMNYADDVDEDADAESLRGNGTNAYVNHASMPDATAL